MTTTNRLLIIIGVLAIIVLGLVVYTFAILLPGQNQSAASVTPTPVTTPTVDSGITANKPRRYTGTIESIGNQTLTILRSKKLLTVNVDTSTTYSTPRGKSFSDLEVGQFVVVKGQPDAQDNTTVTASSITVTTAKVAATATP